MGLLCSFGKERAGSAKLFEEVIRELVDDPFREARSVHHDSPSLSRMIDEMIVVLIVEVHHEAHIGAVLFGTKPAPDTLTQSHFRFASARENYHPDGGNVDAHVKNG